MLYHSKLIDLIRKSNTLKTRVSILIVIIILIWVFHVGVISAIIMSIMFVGWIISLIFDILTISKIIKEYKKIIQKEDDEVKKRKDDLFNHYYNHYRKKTSNNFDSIFNQMLKDMLNDNFGGHNQNRQYHTHYANQDKLKNAYKLLRLQKTDSINKIKTTYKTLAIKWHPDKWATSTDQNKIISLRNFKKLQSAYELIKKDKNIV